MFEYRIHTPWCHSEVSTNQLLSALYIHIMQSIHSGPHCPWSWDETLIICLSLLSVQVLSTYYSMVVRHGIRMVLTVPCNVGICHIVSWC